MNEYEIVGAEEILLKETKRMTSLRADSEHVDVLFMSLKDFRERIIVPHKDIRESLYKQFCTKEVFLNERKSDIEEYIISEEQL